MGVSRPERAIVTVAKVSNDVVGMNIFSNALMIIAKTTLPGKSAEIRASSHLYKYLDSKSYGRCVVHMLPIIGKTVTDVYDDAKAAYRSRLDKVIEKVRKNGLDLERCGAWFKNNERVVAFAVSQNGLALRHASKRLRDNDYVVGQAYANDPKSLQYASARVQRQMRKITESAGITTEHRDEDVEDTVTVKAAYRSKKEEKIAMVSENGLTLQWCSKQLRNDRDVVLPAIWQNGLALQYASKRLRDDDDTVQRAVAQDPRALQYASKRIQRALIKIDARHLDHVDAEVAKEYRDALQGAGRTATGAEATKTTGVLSEREKEAKIAAAKAYMRKVAREAEKDELNWPGVQ